MFGHQVIEDIKKFSGELKKRASDEIESYRQVSLSMARKIRSAQHFHVSDIDGLFDASRRYNGHRLFNGELADIRLPYPTCWFDYTCEESNAKESEKVTRRGVLAFEVKEDLIQIFIFNYLKELGHWTMGFQGYTISVGKPMKHHRDVIQWALRGAARAVARHGVDEEKLEANVWPFPVYPLTLYDVDGAMRDDYRELAALNLVLMLLGCKNIGTRVNHPPAARNKKRRKSGKQELFSYKTLIIKPTGMRRESESEHLWNNRIHLCRGHFKTYTADNPLFGRLTGRYWWQPHVRGRNKDGVVMKDYTIKTGA